LDYFKFKVNDRVKTSKFDKKATMYKRLLILMMLIVVTGCRNIEGPRYHKEHPEKIDSAVYNIDEQKRRGRELIALPEASQNVAPKTGIDTYGPSGRW
jgi:hypothetical protein